MNKNSYSKAEGELVRGWGQRFLELLGLINEVTGADEPGCDPPPPTGLDEVKYSELRAWFMEHRAPLYPIWNEFVDEVMRNLTSKGDRAVPFEELGRVNRTHSAHYLDDESLSFRANRNRDTCGGYEEADTILLADLENDEDFSEAIKNPFIRYYYPRNFRELAWNLGLQEGVDSWEPDQERAGRLRAELVQLADLTSTFVEWMRARTLDV